MAQSLLKKTEKKYVGIIPKRCAKSAVIPAVGTGTGFTALYLSFLGDYYLCYIYVFMYKLCVTKRGTY